ncbi:hypothetical protein [Agriterribacter sp.]|uniref:hypothetical protein n=1 Tax=Agriterribacter sp. TaxID=2821509 RepID=UPI002BB22C73|nr:hypothetical protein [Agriterribacter sp.]HRP56427.1 hypothetical protein [Agriterribacter sp.]
MNKENEKLQRCATRCENPLDQAYRNLRWEKNETGWDTMRLSRHYHTKEKSTQKKRLPY